MAGPFDNTNPLFRPFLGSPDAAPNLSANIGLPSSTPALVAPISPAVTRTPRASEIAQSNYNAVAAKPTGVDSISNPVLKGLARAGDITASIFAPRVAQFIPGTTLNHERQVGIAANRAKESASQDAALGNIAQDEATTEKTRQDAALAPTRAQDQHDLSQAQIGNLESESYLRTHPIATNEFQLWRQQNPNGTAEDFQKLQSKPLSKEEAASRNAVWDTIADKYHLPKGQFREGMSGTDATALAGSLNQVIGRQQGAQSIVIRNEVANAAAAGKAPINASDPGTQAAVSGVADGSLKLADVFGRGATTAQKAQFVAEVKKVNPGYNSGDHDIENGARRYMISGQGGQTLNAINTAYHHLDQFDTVAKALKNGNSKALNQIANELGVQVQNGASPQVVADLVKNALKGEIAKAFTGAGATVDEQRNLDSSFGNANSLDTMLAVSNRARKLLEGKETSLKGQYDKGSRGEANFGALEGGNSSDKVDGHWDPVTKKVVYH